MVARPESCRHNGRVFLALCTKPREDQRSPRMRVPVRPARGASRAPTRAAGGKLGVGTAPHPSPASLRSALNDGLPGGEGGPVAVRGGERVAGGARPGGVPFGASGHPVPPVPAPVPQAGGARLAVGAGRVQLEARNPVSSRNRVSMPCPDSPEWPQGQMAAFPLPSRTGRRSSAGCMTSTGSRCRSCRGMAGSWPSGVSVQGYNTQEDVEALAIALAELPAIRA